MSIRSAVTRPRSVTITLLGGLLLGGWNVGRAIVLGRQSRLLLTFDIDPDPRLRLIIAVIWALLFWGVAFALWRRRPFTRWAVPLLIFLYTVYEVGLIAFFAQSPLAQLRWPVTAVAYLVVILFTYWALNRSAVITYFDIGGKESGD